MRRGRKPIEHPETASRILAAAEKVFAEQGLAGARTEEITRAARVNKALLYYYFHDKRRLHRAVLENLYRGLQSSIAAAAPADPSPRAALFAFIDGYYGFVSAHPNYPKIIQRVVTQSGPDLDWLVQEWFGPSHRRMVKVIEAGIAAGEFRPVDPHHTVISLIAIMVFYFAAAPVFRRMLGYDPIRKPAIAARKQAIVDFIGHALERPGTRLR